ncbi:MAG: hypothetical protein WCP45_12595 [Verrucomicrobiota bacterium]
MIDHLLNNPVLLKTLHLVGVFVLFAALGAVLLGGAGRMWASMLHGMALLLIIVVGFAMLKKPPMGQYWWMLKLAMWGFLGVAPVLAKRKVLPGALVLLLCLAAAAFAAWLGLRRSF